MIAEDSGVPPRSSTAEVELTIIDVNDNPPAWIFPGVNKNNTLKLSSKRSKCMSESNYQEFNKNSQCY